MKSAAKRKEQIRRKEVAEERQILAEEGATKPKLAAVPLKPSAYARKALREDEERKEPTPGLSDFSRKKHRDDPNFANLPKDLTAARLHACANCRAVPHPELAFPGSVEQ